MHNVLDAPAQARVLENPVSYAGPIESTVSPQDLSSEQCDKLVETGLTRLQDFSGKPVGVQHRHPAPREHALHGAFSATDAAREAYAKSGTHLVPFVSPIGSWPPVMRPELRGSACCRA